MDQPLAQLQVQHQRISFQGSKPGMSSGHKDIHIQHIHSGQDSKDQLLAQLLVQHQQISFQGSKQGMSSGRRDIQHIHIHKLNSMDQPLVQLLVRHRQISFQYNKLGRRHNQHSHMGIRHNHKLQSSMDLHLLQPLDQQLLQVQQKLLQEQ